MNFLFLQHFYSVAKWGGFTRAARELRVSQPTLSRSVSLLEKDCGKTLLLRGKGGAQLTEDGRSLFQKCTTVFDALDSVENHLHGRHEKSLNIRIGASENLCIHVLPQITAELSAGHSIEWDIFSGTAETIQQRLLGYEADIGFFYNPSKSPDLQTEEVANVRFVAVASKKTGARIRKPSQLQDLVYVGSRGQEYRSKYIALDSLHKMGIHPKQIIQCNSQEFQIRRASHEDAFSVVPEFAAREYIDRSELVRIPSVHFSTKLYSAARKDFTLGANPIYQQLLRKIRLYTVP